MKDVLGYLRYADKEDICCGLVLLGMFLAVPVILAVLG